MILLRNKKDKYLLEAFDYSGRYYKLFENKEEMLKCYDCDEEHLPSWVEIVDVNVIQTGVFWSLIIGVVWGFIMTCLCFYLLVA